MGQRALQQKVERRRHQGIEGGEPTEIGDAVHSGAVLLLGGRLWAGSSLCGHDGSRGGGVGCVGGQEDRIQTD
jgi:hypothetical protein